MGCQHNYQHPKSNKNLTLNRLRSPYFGTTLVKWRMPDRSTIPFPTNNGEQK